MIDQTTGKCTAALDVHLEELRQAEAPREVAAEQRADEAERDRGEAAAAREAGERLPDGAADARDDQQNEEVQERHVGRRLLLFDRGVERRQHGSYALR